MDKALYPPEGYLITGSKFLRTGEHITVFLGPAPSIAVATVGDCCL